MERDHQIPTPENQSQPTLKRQLTMRASSSTGKRPTKKNLATILQLNCFAGQTGIIGSSKGEMRVENLTEGATKDLVTSEPSQDHPKLSIMDGMISVIGKRGSMEDTVSLLPRFFQKENSSFDFFGVYDGHGGDQVAKLCKERLHQVLLDLIGGTLIDVGENDVVDWSQLFQICFRKMDDQANEVSTAGSTALVALVGLDKIMVANCGDSRAILCRNGALVELSHDHKPGRPDEKDRIENAGGFVSCIAGRWRLNATFAVSRALGNPGFKPMLTSVPEVEIITRNEKDEFMILATDGLWDKVSSEVACGIVRKYLRTGRADGKNFVRGQYVIGAAALLAAEALNLGSSDNVSVVVVALGE